MPAATGWSSAPTRRKNHARGAILLRRSRIERPKEALFEKSKRPSLLFLCVAWRLGESQFLIPNPQCLSIPFDHDHDQDWRRSRPLNSSLFPLPSFLFPLGANGASLWFIFRKRPESSRVPAGYVRCPGPIYSGSRRKGEPRAPLHPVIRRFGRWPNRSRSVFAGPCPFRPF